MTRTSLALAAVFLAIGLVGLASAVPRGFTVEFDGNGEGRVVFSGTAHSPGKPHCSDCHMAVFDVSRSSQITRPDHKRKQACFVCHDGKQAFAARMNCDRCHMPVEEPAVEPLPVPTGQ
jgi:c(7)-type cytochrome triheme protein